ncbi:hypothetical protein D8R48_18045 [Salmonella enterica subsp. enterica serovar Newport]|nr:hypothetical protein [Salmonella enterica subsp. enterica serovar Newport]ECA5314137.1 hypothetical protein [Salmonella enterica subsp. enterica serovar Oranienburg]ECJ2932456.1 hypothetical protein [Salmonella enterica subsp. enterica serovar Brazzaville]ECZ9690460.1 hypothetical protein [Salmonella enterica subsp. enterica serovar Potsdam]EDU3720064.1 hypothetical protein [Salmonella enterica subsp. diarizonae]EDV5410080.1 hypothetical protein [Salmonella enterica subsp. enterica]
MKVQAVGIFWFRDTLQYHEYKKIFTDADVLAASYTDWKRDAEKLIKRVERNGQRVIKAEAETAEFITWCVDHGIGIDAKGRAQFASFKAHQQLVGKS